jgi:hypothetical protein
MLNYLKSKNDGLFNSLENLSDEYGNVVNCQNYIPIYETLFKKSDEDNEDTFLVSNEVVTEISHKENNKFSSVILDISNNSKSEKEIFIKFSPIMNLTRYLTGKYEKEDIFTLPKNRNSKCHGKILDVNNTSYTDSFFSYISSILLNDYNMFHGINYYGSFIGIKNNYKVNVDEDIDYLIESEYFMNNMDSHYRLTGDMEKVNEIKSMNNVSKKYKSKLVIKDDWNDNTAQPMIEDKMMDFEDVFKEEKKVLVNDIDELTVFNINRDVISDDISLDEDSEDSNSSRSVNTGELSEDDMSSDEDDMCSDDECSDDDDLDCIDINVVIDKFPVQLICMEHCVNTFDSLIENGLGKDEWVSALFQIVMILIIYQKSFWFTHNDLHSNNIMYQETNKKFMYYKYNETFYKIPTFGRVYKIIDFGRSIYKFKKYLYCPDAFKKGDDAASQYNFGIYYDNKKKEVLPNFSFDLCRLACSIFDNIFTFNMADDYSQKYIDNKCKKDEIAKLVNDWCKDDKGRNVLYTSEGDERYPEFKLYKMIARTVNNCLPEKQLEKSIFSKFVVSKKIIRNNLRDKNVLYLDIDSIPKMYADVVMNTNELDVSKLGIN